MVNAGLPKTDNQVACGVRQASIGDDAAFACKPRDLSARPNDRRPRGGGGAIPDRQRYEPDKRL